MDISDLGLIEPETSEDMARANARPLDAARVEQLVHQLRSKVSDAGAFKSVHAQIATDATLSAREVMLIAHNFVGGTMPKTRKAAVTAIGQERLRVSHSRAKGALAGRTRVW